MEESKTSNLAWLPFLLGLCTSIGMYAGYKLQIPKTDYNINKEYVNPSYASQQKFQDVLSYLQSKYVDSLNYEETSDFLIQQLMYALDPYSEYLEKKELKSLKDDLDGIYQGAGISFRIIDDQAYISNIVLDGPASKVGLEPGDIVKEINSRVLLSNNMQIDSIVEFTLLDKEKMSLVIQKSDNLVDQKIVIDKTDIKNFSIGPVTLLDNATFYLKISRFGENTYKEFMREVEEYVYTKKFHNIVIDLRSNSGGLLNSAADILNQLVQEPNTVLFKTKDRNNQERVYKSTGKPFFNIEKIYILIDKNTASASEVLAGVLQDLNRAKIIGSNSFGKATVLELFPLADGSALELANARIYLPSGRCIQKSYNTKVDSNLHWLSPFIADTSVIHKGGKSYSYGVGIIPDVFVNNSEQDSIQDEELKELVSDFVITNYQSLKILVNKKNEESLISTFALKNWINISHDKFIIKNKDAILKELKFQIVRFFEGENAEKILHLNSDSTIIKTIELLKQDIQK
ncbi:MAG: S41 family peptidase [Saprospiraceae bacterium]